MRRVRRPGGLTDALLQYYPRRIIGYPNLMSRRARRRFVSLIRLLAVMVFAMTLLIGPVLSSISEVHELAHDPSGQHSDVESGHGRSTHNTVQEQREGKAADALHALLHFAHCCGQASAAFQAQVIDAVEIEPVTPPAAFADATVSRARWYTPFRPPIES